MNLPQTENPDDLSRSVAAHDLHFLSRTMRCDGEALERAMRLYHHSEVLRKVIPEILAFFPDRERAAIPLLQSHPTPHVIVTKEGAFVTCLAEGMSIRDLPVVPYSKLQEAMDLADKKLEGNLVATRQQDELPLEVLLKALYEGPGHISREMVELIQRRPETYDVVVAKVLISNLQGYARQVLMERTLPFTPRKLAIIAEKRCATIRICFYLCATLHTPLIYGVLRHFANYNSGFTPEVLTALARHPEGGDAMMELIDNPAIPDQIKKHAPLMLLHHSTSYPQNAYRYLRRFKHLPLDFDGWDAMFVVSKILMDCASPKDVERLMSAPRENTKYQFHPRCPQWLLTEAELFGEVFHCVNVAAIFPPRSKLQEVKDAWAHYLRSVTDERKGQQKIATVRNENPRVGRNEPCPCGSGKKFKLCCVSKNQPAPKPDPVVAAKAEADRKRAARELWVREVLDRAPKLIADATAEAEQRNAASAEAARNTEGANADNG